MRKSLTSIKRYSNNSKEFEIWNGDEKIALMKVGKAVWEDEGRVRKKNDKLGKCKCENLLKLFLTNDNK